MAAGGVLDDMAVLSREPEFLLREELRDLIPYHAVLMALAQGKTAPVELAGATGIDSRRLNYHLQNLMELGHVQRRFPLTEGKPSARSVRYALDDPFLRFWFRFVFPHQSVLRLLGPHPDPDACRQPLHAEGPLPTQLVMPAAVP